MNKLIDGLSMMARTENGAPQYNSTGCHCLDFFAKIGSMRGQSEEAFRLFRLAFVEDPDIAIRILMWAYDCRGGAGEREIFKEIFLNAAKEGLLEPYWSLLLSKIPQLGRFDMLVDILSDERIKPFKNYQEKILKIIQHQLSYENALCAKWLPRQGLVAERVRNWLNVEKKEKLSRKDFRKLLVNLSAKGNVVEQKMSANHWDQIDFSKVPSIASARYANAFSKHEAARYQQYLKDVNAGKAKMNMNVAFPYDLVRMVKTTLPKDVIDAANTAYDQMTKNFVIDRNVLVMADVSGSMTLPVSGSVTARDIAVGTAICIAEHNTGCFKDCVLTFSDDVQLVKLKGTFAQKVYTLWQTQNPYGTNFERAYNIILDVAIRKGLKQEELPESILVITDMEFDMPENFDDAHINIIKERFEHYGYTAPNIIFWNVNQRSNGYALRSISENCAMISGYSIAIARTVFSSDEINPTEIMMKTVMIPRYDTHFDLTKMWD